MNKIVPMAAAAGLMVGGLTACGGESAKEVPAQVEGYGYGTDVAIVEDQWIHHEGALRLPSGTQTDNIQTHNKFVGCHEVGDNFWSLNWDDEECLGLIYDGVWTSCSSGEGTHCEAQREPRYDFDALEPVTVRNCIAPIVKTEFQHDQPVRDEACIAMVGADQRMVNVPRFLIWVSADNPKFDAKHPDKHPQRLTEKVEISQTEWSTLKGEVEVTAKVSGDHVVDVVIK